MKKFLCLLTLGLAAMAKADSLTVRFYGKVFLLPSEDAPMMGMAEDGMRVAVFRRKGNWSQISFHNATGWIVDPSVRFQSNPNSGGLKNDPGEIAAEESGTAESHAFSPLGITLIFGLGISSLLGLFGLLHMLRSRNTANSALQAGRNSVHLVGPTQKNIESANPAICSLEGKITDNGLPEILQFLELGRRTGLLNIEDGRPVGVINFTEGIISFAQTQFFEGADAVMEILTLSGGSFQFFADKRIHQANCRLSAFEMLLHVAHREDETGKFAFPSNI